MKSAVAFLFSYCIVFSGFAMENKEIRIALEGSGLNQPQNQHFKMPDFSQQTLSLLQNIPEQTLQNLLIHAQNTQQNNVSHNTSQKNPDLAKTVLQDLVGLTGQFNNYSQNPVLGNIAQVANQLGSGLLSLSPNDHSKIQTMVEGAMGKVVQKLPHAGFTYTSFTINVFTVVFWIVYAVVYIYSTYLRTI